MYDEAKHLMQRQGDEANDYLRNMVQNNEGFADRDERAKPLKTFYTLVPAITINYLKHVVQGRENLTKRNNSNAFISDDGFALGIVFMLKILGVTDEFNSLNWFDSIELKLKADAEKFEKSRSKTKQTLDENKIKSNLYEDDNFEEELTIRRNYNELQEARLLNYNLTAAAILFKEI